MQCSVHQTDSYVVGQIAIKVSIICGIWAIWYIPDNIWHDDGYPLFIYAYKLYTRNAILDAIFFVFKNICKLSKIKSVSAYSICTQNAWFWAHQQQIFQMNAKGKESRNPWHLQKSVEIDCYYSSVV